MIARLLERYSLVILIGTDARVLLVTNEYCTSLNTMQMDGPAGQTLSCSATRIGNEELLSTLGFCEAFRFD